MNRKNKSRISFQILSCSPQRMGRSIKLVRELNCRIRNLKEAYQQELKVALRSSRRSKELQFNSSYTRRTSKKHNFNLSPTRISNDSTMLFNKTNSSLLEFRKVNLEIGAEARAQRRQRQDRQLKERTQRLQELQMDCRRKYLDQIISRDKRIAFLKQHAGQLFSKQNSVRKYKSKRFLPDQQEENPIFKRPSVILA